MRGKPPEQLAGGNPASVLLKQSDFTAAPGSNEVTTRVGFEGASVSACRDLKQDNGFEAVTLADNHLHRRPIPTAGVSQKCHSPLRK